MIICNFWLFIYQQSLIYNIFFDYYIKQVQYTQISHFDMTSIIHQILKQCENPIKYHQNCASNQQTTNLSSGYLIQKQKIGRHYLHIVLLNNFQSSEFKKYDEKQYQKRFAFFMEGLKTKYERSQKYICIAFGMYASQKTSQMENLNLQFKVTLNEFMNYLYEKKQKQQIQMDSLSIKSSCISHISQKKSQANSKMRQKSQFSDCYFDSNDESDIENKSSTMDKSLQFVYQDEQQQNKIKTIFKSTLEQARFKEVVQYLQKLGSAQSQLTYICQHMGWEPPRLTQVVYDQNVPNFKCTCLIKVYNQIEIQSKPCIQKSKKKGRSISSTLVLKKLYLEHPDIWIQYQKIKEQKCLNVQQGDQKSAYFKKLIHTIADVKEVVLVKPQKKKELTQADKYMQSVKSSKAELNLLIQQCPGKITCPKPEKIAEANTNKWKIVANVTVNHKYSTFSIKKDSSDKNSKIAQQKAIRECLSELYERFPEILEKMNDIKTKKGIST